jgi:hypothetical protein
MANIKTEKNFEAVAKLINPFCKKIDAIVKQVIPKEMLRKKKTIGSSSNTSSSSKSQNKSNNSTMLNIEEGEN